MSSAALVAHQERAVACLDAHTTSFDLRISSNAVWCRLKASAAKFVSRAHLDEMRQIDEQIMNGAFGSPKFKVISSDIRDVFSLGGDIEFFLHCINHGKTELLTNYALLSIRAVWANVSGLSPRALRTVAVVEGEAQGGGFEAALSCDVIIAERGNNFGFPESLFGMFPGMGGEILLRSRVDGEVARKMVRSAHRYTAEFLNEIGVIDFIAPKGKAMQMASDLTDGKIEFDFGKRRTRMQDAVNLTALVEGVEAWVDQSGRLSKQNLRAMQYILGAQQPRSTKAA